MVRRASRAPSVPTDRWWRRVGRFGETEPPDPSPPRWPTRAGKVPRMARPLDIGVGSGCREAWVSTLGRSSVAGVATGGIVVAVALAACGARGSWVAASAFPTGSLALGHPALRGEAVASTGVVQSRVPDMSRVVAGELLVTIREPGATRSSPAAGRTTRADCDRAEAIRRTRDVHRAARPCRRTGATPGRRRRRCPGPTSGHGEGPLR
jgi:hypothetical protein